ncbi:MAG TPA: winged helix-turn-helix domain-containing protein [Cyclobacteriaceae bacterium]
MRVNSAVKGFFNNRLVAGSVPIAIGTVMMVAIFLIASSFTKHTDRDVRAKETNIIIRNIGHQLLLQGGDKTSRVLPVTEIKEGTFQLTFEHRLFFNHDSLMALTQRLLPKEQFPSGYTVTVHDCHDPEIVYGFQINNTRPDILACQGRSQPQGCYIFEFMFPDFYATTYNYPFISLAGGMLVLSFVMLLIGRFGKRAVASPVLNHNHSIIRESVVPELAALGKFLFDVKNQRLLLENEMITLTDKECKILELLNANFGELTPRETLMQVWVNEGVITGRSLDMFVSKLRKKLSSDPELKITNVHGKGYKLEARS